MSISISSVGKTLGCLLVAASCGWVIPADAQVTINNSRDNLSRDILIAQAPTSSLQQQAEIAYTQGDAARAVFLYSQLLQQQPNNYQYQIRTAIALLNAGPEYIAQSYAAFQRAKDLNPNIDEPWIFLGKIDEAFERPNQALANYQRAFQLNPANQEAFSGTQRLQSQTALPAFAEDLFAIEKRPLAEYIAAVEPNSRLLQGLRAQQSIVQSQSARSLLPSVGLGYSRSGFDSSSLNPQAPTFCADQESCVVKLERGFSYGSSDNYSLSLGWSLGDIFFNENNLRSRAYEDDIATNLRNLQLETQRLFALRGSLIEEFRQLAWQAAVNPSDRTVRYNRRDRYLQILYITQQIHSITGLY
jgi:tetratricopeptide (TPR) repeat protein